MKKLAFISILLLGIMPIYAAVNAELPKKLKIGMPKVMKPGQEGTYKWSDLNHELSEANKWGTKNMGNAYWIVWSDRDHNTVYTDAQRSGTTGRSLNLGDAVIIADVQGSMAMVYQDDTRNKKWPEVTDNAKLIGWVPMKNLILWDRCPTSDVGIYQKALIAIHLNDLKTLKRFVYREPEEKEEGRQDLTMDMKFYFIMKEEGQMALLCDNPTILPGGSNLTGWVHSSNFAKWNQRACLEPNWDEEFVNDNKGKDVASYIKPSASSGHVFKWIYGTANGDKDNEVYNYRMAPDLLRFPIMSKEEDNNDVQFDATEWVHCTVFADAKTGTLNPFDPDAPRKVEEHRKNGRLMNVIFVVEATQEMGLYLEAVKQSLSKCKDYANLKVGLVLYRSGTGRDAVEMVKLSSWDDANLMAMLNSINANGRWIGNNRTVALKQALETATNPGKMGFIKDNRNLVIVVGKHGPVEDNLADDAMLQRFTSNDIQLMSVQVQTSEAGSVGRYGRLIEPLIVNSVNKQYSSIGDKAEYKRMPRNEGYRYVSLKADNVLFSRMVYPANEGESFSAADITKHLDSGISTFSKSVKNWGTRFENDMNDVGKPGFDSAFLIHHLGKELYDRVKTVKAISAFDGFSKLKNLKDENYWHYIVFMSNNELHQVLENLKPTYQAAMNKSDDRKKYIEAVATLAKSLVGQNDDKEIGKMSLKELQKLLFGLTVTTDATGRSLDDISDNSKVRRDEYQDILEVFARKYDALYEIYTSNYRYRTKVGDDYYYWIPVEKIP